jgi:hypothetical protein
VDENKVNIRSNPEFFQQNRNGVSEFAQPLVPISKNSQFVVGASTNKPASNASQYQFYGLKEDLIECVHCLIVAIIAGFVTAAYTRRPRRDSRTYPQKGDAGE